MIHTRKSKNIKRAAATRYTLAYTQQASTGGGGRKEIEQKKKSCGFFIPFSTGRSWSSRPGSGGSRTGVKLLLYTADTHTHTRAHRYNKSDTDEIPLGRPK